MDVIIPVSDAADHIIDCVASLARLTPRPDRVIVVDDHSGDRSGPLALAAITAAGLAGTLITHAHRRGPGAARNRGLAAATAPLVWFVDADDTVDPDALRILLDALGEHDFAVCRTSLACETGEVDGIDEPPPDRAAVTGLEYAGMLLDGRARAYAPTKLFRRALLPARPWDEVRRYEDLAAMIALACSARTVALVAEAPYRYHRRGGSASRIFDPASFELLALPERALSRLRAAGAAPTRAAAAEFTAREAVFPLAHLAMRAAPDPDAARAIRAAGRMLGRADLVALAGAGHLRTVAATVLLKTFPRCYARILRTR
ncbi:glycosyltransferase family 2 protein [Nocardia sp. NBC_01377]